MPRAADRLRAFLLFVPLLLVACGESGPEVVLYVSADEYLARNVAAAFEDETGITVRLVGDTEAKKTTGLVERLRAERNAPQADVFWSSEHFQTIALAAEDVLEPYASPEASAWPAKARDADGRWYGFAARARVIVFDPERVPESERPAAWTDLARLPGPIAIADPRFGTTGGHLAAMLTYWERAAFPGFYEAFLEGLSERDVRLMPNGNAGVVEAVANGEARFGLTDTDDVWAAQAQGRRVACVFPDHTREDEPGNGTLLIYNTVGVVRGARHPEAARRLVDFLLSEATERRLAESVSRNVPVRPGLAASFPDLEIRDPLDYSLRRASARRSDAIETAMRILTATTDDAP